MTRRALIVAGLLVGVCATPSRSAGAANLTGEVAPACPPAAAVQGPPEIVGPIVAILSSHGVATGSGACGGRSVKALLVAHADTDGYRLHVSDAVGHSSIRQVADAATAATLIESWAMGEDADVWSPRPGPHAVEAAAADRPAAASPEGDRDPADDHGRAGVSGAGAQLGVAAEASIRPDDAVWWGASATGCARLGPLCVGARAGITRAETTLLIDRALGIAPDLTRTLGSLSAHVSWPVSARPFWVAPSLGLGAAWLHSQATQAGVTSTTDDVLARGEAGAVAGVTIGRGWSIGLGLGASVALASRGDARQGTMTYVPAAPRGFLTTGVGVWYAP